MFISDRCICLLVSDNVYPIVFDFVGSVMGDNGNGPSDEVFYG